MWYFNAGESPTQNILNQQPQLVHRVKLDFGVENLSQQIYKEWEYFFTILTKYFTTFPFFRAGNFWEFKGTCLIPLEPENTDLCVSTFWNKNKN